MRPLLNRGADEENAPKFPARVSRVKPPLQPSSTGDDGLVGKFGNTERPREMPAPQPGPGSVTPSGGGVSRRSAATPSQPSAPSPVASQPPAPFTPMAGGMVPTVGRMLFGRAGGLLGGGLGVPGAIGDEGGEDISALMELLKLAGARE